MKLYDLTQNYLNLLALLENPEIPQELINQSLNEVEGQFEEKAENVAKIMKMYEGDIAAFKDEEKRLSERRRVIENRIKNLKEYLDSSMKATGKTKIKGKLFNFSIGKNPPSVDVFNQKLIPKKFFEDQEPVLNKKELLAALKAGEKIEGATIKQTESIRIK